jgi:uncharacterized damage-inducible protein DinB
MFAEYLRQHWADVRSKLSGLVGRLDDADLDFRAYEGAWSIGELVLHIAHEEYGEVGYGITDELQEWPPEFPGEETEASSRLLSRLAEVHAATERFMEGLTDAELGSEIETPWGAKDTTLGLLSHVIEHEIHHRGELSLLLGMRGKPGLDA